MKRISVLIAILMLFVMVVPTMAASESEDNSSTQVVQDYRKMPHKEFSPKPTGFAAARASGPEEGDWVANIEANRATSDSYWDQEHSRRWPIDTIEAYYRAYRGNSLVYSDIDTQNNASHAAAGYDHVMADEIIGQHYFEEEGYQSWEVETYY